jgi:hypothetical protein
MIHFHGGCIGCTQQDRRDTDFCYDCCYFAADWEKPNLYNSLTKADIERQRIINRRKSPFYFLTRWYRHASVDCND